MKNHHVPRHDNDSRVRFCSQKIRHAWAFAIEPFRAFSLSELMNEPDSVLSLLLLVALPVLLFLAFCTFLIVIRLSARLRRLEQVLLDSSPKVEEKRVVKRDSPKQEASEFEDFLREDGSRRILNKREQAAAFREWRRLRGKTWSPGEKSDGLASTENG